MAVEYYSSPIGLLEIKADEAYILEIIKVENVSSAGEPNYLTSLAIAQLKEYFTGNRTEFELPLGPSGTDFQKSVWAELVKIPFGKTITYSSLARAVNRPKAARAVGNAVGKNPLLIVIPCHRVVAAAGLGGFSAGLETKKILLKHETPED